MELTVTMIDADDVARSLNIKIEILGDQCRHSSCDLGLKAFDSALSIVTLRVDYWTIALWVL